MNVAAYSTIMVNLPSTNRFSKGHLAIGVYDYISYHEDSSEDLYSTGLSDCDIMEIVPKLKEDSK